MIKYICPICDNFMSSSHFCTGCRSWVKKPWVRDVNYYLNERHPQMEEACDYHEQESPAQIREDSIEIVNHAQSGPLHNKYIQNIINNEPLKRKISEEEENKNNNNLIGSLVFLLAVILLMCYKYA